MRIALVIAVIGCGGSAPPSPPPPVPAPAPAPAPAPTSPPALTYTEDGDALRFWPPTRLQLVRAGGKTCDSQLSTGKDNMWTGPDVEAALADPDVQALVTRGGESAYLPEIDDASVIHEGALQIGKAKVTWTLHPCHWCVPESPGVARLRKILSGVMSNRRSLCS